MARRIRSYRSSSYGRERALQHIQEARELTQRLGGADQDVKRWFFGLPSAQLHPILEDYQRRYGASAREYADETMDKWRSGRVQMGGMVASRLFDMLPQHMPLTTKYSISAKLWHHCGPSSHEVLRAEPGVSPYELVARARVHFEKTVAAYTIPRQLSDQFQWLAGGDVSVQQQLLNHHMAQERDFVLEALPAKLDKLLATLRRHGDVIKAAHEIIEIGKHKFEIRIGQPTLPASGTKAPTAQSAALSSRIALWVWILVGIAVIRLLLQLHL